MIKKQPEVQGDQAQQKRSGQSTSKATSQGPQEGKTLETQSVLKSKLLCYSAPD